MFDIPKIKNELKDLNQILDLAEAENIMEMAEKMSAEKVCKTYIESNKFEYIYDEVRAAFRAGFFCCLRQKLIGKFEDRE